jgi:hypothetical protein
MQPAEKVIKLAILAACQARNNNVYLQYFRTIKDE